MKLRLGMMAVAATLFVALGTGCSSNKTNAERDSLLNQNKELQQQLDAEKAARAQADARANAVPAAPTPDVATQPPSMGGDGGIVEMGGPSSSGGRGGRTTRGGAASSGGEATNGAGEVVIELAGDTLFDSGKATIKASAKKTLDGVAARIKKEYSGRTLRIEGYTDPTPVKSSGWDDNWDLGFVRARAVQKYLVSKGVPERDTYAASFGSTHLRSTKVYSQDRRVDIVVVENGK